jgi:biopolymer transport protein ExbD
MSDISLSGKNNPKTKNRRSTRVDLTPMVDLGFLLLTFFVFTTSMTEAKALDILEPIDGPAKNIKESGAMTLILSKKHQIYYYYRSLADSSQLQKTNFQNVRALILNKKRHTKLSDLMYIIKADGDATFGDIINLLDEMSICDIPQGHYTEADITSKEKESVISDK